MTINGGGFFLFIYVLGWGGRERGRKRIPSRLHIVSAEPDVKLKLINSEIMT